MADKKKPETEEPGEIDGLRDLTGGELVDISGGGGTIGRGKSKGSRVTGEPTQDKITRG